MSRKAQDNLVCVAFIVVFGAFIVLTLQLDSNRARLVPLPIAAGSILLLFLQLYLQNFRPDVRLNVDSIDLFRVSEDVVREEEEVEKVGRKKTDVSRSELSAYAMVAGFGLMVVVIGLLESLFLFALGYLVLFGKVRLHMALAFSGVATAALYVLFFWMLNTEPWVGWMWLALSS